MKVILKEEISGLGRASEIVKVAPGYARNYLIPRDLAAYATENNISRLAHEKRLIAQRQEKAHREANSLADKLKDHSVTLYRQIGGGDDERIFGSVTTRDIADALRNDGYKISRRQIRFEENVRTLGTYECQVKLHASVTIPLKIWVVKE